MNESAYRVDTLPYLTKEELEKRIEIESNPDFYEVRSSKYGGQLKDLESGAGLSGHIDLRGDVSKGDKFGILVGNDHYNLAVEAKFPVDVSFKDYNFGIIFYFDKDLKKIKIRRDSIGNPSERDDHHVQAVISAAEIALQRDLMNAEHVNMYDLLERCSLAQYSFADGSLAIIEPDAASLEKAIADSTACNRYAGYKDTQEFFDSQETFDYVAVPRIEDLKSNDRAEIFDSISKMVAKLSDKEGATVRVAFSTYFKDGEDFGNTMDEISDELRKKFPTLNAHITVVGSIYVEDEQGNKSKNPVGEKKCLIVERI